MNIVQFEGDDLMNRTITSKECILEASKSIASVSGMSALNIRDVARKCEISVGSVYNYFPSKDDLVFATVESIWTEILMSDDSAISQKTFTDAVSHFFERVLFGTNKYPSFLDAHSMRSMDTSKEKGRGVMNRFFGKVMNDLLVALDGDPQVRKDAFSEDFTKEAFVGFVFSNVLSLVMNRKNSCAFLLKVIKRTVY